jgi:hypothetical protein
VKAFTRARDETAALTDAIAKLEKESTTAWRRQLPSQHSAAWAPIGRAAE